MAAVTWDQFYPDVLLWAPGCPEPLMDQELRRAAQEFFTRTLAWRAWLAPITVIDAQRDYDMVLPTGAEIVRLERATSDGKKIDVLLYDDLAADVADQEVDELGVTSADRKVLWLTKQLAAGVIIKVKAALKPSDAAVSIPGELFDQYSIAIAQGARSRLQLVKSTAFYDVGQATIAAAAFQAAIGSVAAAVFRGNLSSTPRATVKWC